MDGSNKTEAVLKKRDVHWANVMSAHTSKTDGRKRFIRVKWVVYTYLYSVQYVYVSKRRRGHKEVMHVCVYVCVERGVRVLRVKWMVDSTGMWR